MRGGATRNQTPLSCGNAGLWKEWKAKRRLPTLTTALGNLADSRRDSHIPTASTTKADGKVENQKQVSHFPTAIIHPQEKSKHEKVGAPRRLRSNCR